MFRKILITNLLCTTTLLTSCAALQELDQAAGRALGIKATPPIEQRYDRQSWATVSVQQAEAECYDSINRPGGSANLYLCMKSKGYNER